MKLRQAKKILKAYNCIDGADRLGGFNPVMRLLAQGNPRMLRAFRIVVRHMMRVLRYKQYENKEDMSTLNVFFCVAFGFILLVAIMACACMMFGNKDNDDEA